MDIAPMVRLFIEEGKELLYRLRKEGQILSDTELKCLNTQLHLLQMETGSLKQKKALASKSPIPPLNNLPAKHIKEQFVGQQESQSWKQSPQPSSFTPEVA